MVLLGMILVATLAVIGALSVLLLAFLYYEELREKRIAEKAERGYGWNEEAEMPRQERMEDEQWSGQ